MQHLLHFAEDSDTSGFFPQLARWHDRSRYRMFFGTLKPMAPWLRAYMEAHGVECFSCAARRRLAYPAGMLRFAGFMSQRRIDILHTHLFEPSVIGLAAGVLAGIGIRVMTRHHSDYHTRIHKHWHVRLDRLCTQLSHAVIDVSQHTADHLIREEKAPAAKVYPICNGIDFARIQLSGADARTRIRREFAAEDAYLLLVAARLHPEKGYEYLFRALAKMKSKLDRPVLLLVAGRGTYEEYYRAQACALGCRDAVRFLGFRKDVQDLMAAADLVVLPSLAEAFGLALTEALYLGTPVVASRVGGIPEIVSDGVDGVLVAPADSQALADAIAGLLRNPERRRQMAGAGRQKVWERFRFEDMVRAYEKVYRGLTSRACGMAVAAGALSI